MDNGSNELAKPVIITVRAQPLFTFNLRMKIDKYFVLSISYTTLLLESGHSMLPHSASQNKNERRDYH